MRDELFKQEIQKQFEFDERVASVFDDMLKRSIPFYDEQVRLIAYFVDLALPKTGGRVYDLGSSTGNVLFEILKNTSKEVECIGIDNSVAMCERARLKAKAYGSSVQFVSEDFFSYPFFSSNAVIANYTMQFVRPMQREKMIAKVYESLQSGGVFLMGEKMISTDRVLDKAMIDCYCAYKSAQGYSQTEIAQKRQALENVLIPYTQEENFTMLQNAGFESVEVLFKWVNFGLVLARKT